MRLTDKVLRYFALAALTSRSLALTFCYLSISLC